MTDYEDYKNLYESLEKQFSRILGEHSDLTLKCEEYEDKIEDYKDKEMYYVELVEKLYKEREYKTWVVTQYILKYPEYMEVLERKRSRIKKRTHKSEDDEGVEL